MRKAIAAENAKKMFYFLLPAILTLVLVLCIIAVARATETGSPKAGLTAEGMKTEAPVATPAEKSTMEASKEVVEKEVAGAEQSGAQAGQGAVVQEEKAEPAAEKQ